MKIFSLILFNCNTAEKPVVISSILDLSQFGFFKRGTVRDLIFFTSRESIQRTSPRLRQTLTHDLQEAIDGIQHLLVHTHVNEQKLGCVLISDGEYSQRVAHSVIDKALEELWKEMGDKSLSVAQDATYNFDSINEIFAKYQKPEEVDNMMKIQKDLAETREIIIQSIDKLLVRQEKLEDLMQKSQDLSFQSKAFMKKSQDLNRCCTII